MCITKRSIRPQSGAIKNAISDCGFEQVRDVETGKFYNVKIDAADKATAQKSPTELCERFYQIRLLKIMNLT